MKRVWRVYFLYFVFQTKMVKWTFLDEKSIFFLKTFFNRLDLFPWNNFSGKKILKYFSCEFGGSIPSGRTFFFMKCVWCMLSSHPKTNIFEFSFMWVYLPFIGVDNATCTPLSMFITPSCMSRRWYSGKIDILTDHREDLKPQKKLAYVF